MMLPDGQNGIYNFQISPLLTPSLGTFSVEDNHIPCSIQPYLFLGPFLCRSCYLLQILWHGIGRWHHQSKGDFSIQTPSFPNPLNLGPPYLPS